MGGLLHNARKFFRAWTPPPAPRAQAYRVSCPEGHTLLGQRTEGYQALRCPTCGEGVFVLPRSPLPEPAAPSGGVTRSEIRATRQVLDEAPVALTDHETLPEAPETLDEVEWVDADAPAEGEGVESGPTDAGADAVELALAERAEAEVAANPARPATRRRRPVETPEPVPEPEPRRTWGEFARRHRNPLVFAAVALVVCGTVAIRSWRNQRARLPMVAEAGRVEGLAALDAGKFDRANQLLSAARQAVESLGDAFQGAEAIRQGAKEAAIIVKLSPAALEELLDEASRSDVGEWKRRFETMYRGRSVIIEAQVVGVPASDGSGRYELDYRVLPEGEGGEPKTRGEIDTRGLRLLDLMKPKAGDVVTFGALLASFAFDDERGTWLVGLEPESGVTMTHRKALDALRGSSASDLSGAEGNGS